MALAIAARNDGDDYQARYFWRKATGLFGPSTRIIRVWYEAVEPKGFDDIVVQYADDMRGETNQPLVADHVQLKFHQRLNGLITWDALMTPQFINATSTSLLERLRDAYRRYPSGQRRFIFYTPWQVDPHDQLASMRSGRDSRLNLDVFRGGSRSVGGVLRDKLCAHLAVDEEELLALLGAFRLEVGLPLHALNDDLNLHLQLAGLVPVDANALIHPYDELTRKTIRLGREGFNREQIRTLCRQERLWRGHTFTEDGAVRLGIRSYLRAADSIADETDHHLSLIDVFVGRQLRPPYTWADTILPHIQTFLAEQLVRSQRHHLYLPTHTSITYAVGYLLDDKAGFDVVPIQPTTHSWQIWRPARDPDVAAYGGWRATLHEAHTNGTDLAVAISVSHHTLADVTSYVASHQPDIKRILHVHPQDGPQLTSIHDGTHAHLLAHQLIALCQDARRDLPRTGRLHLFAAAPNGFIFFLGQVSRGFGSLVLYEHDFERQNPLPYAPTLSLPEMLVSGVS